MISAVDCGNPTGTIANAALVGLNAGTTSYLDTALVTCIEGYTAMGTMGTITCNSAGTWTGFACNGEMIINFWCFISCANYPAYLYFSSTPT